MAAIILAFSGEQMTEKIARILHAGGYYNLVTCHSGAEVLRVARAHDSCIVISSYRLPDVTAHELMEMGGSQIHPLILLTPAQSELATNEDAFYLPSPISKTDLLSAVKMMETISFRMSEYQEKIARLERQLEDRKLIERAKELLMVRHNMTEEAAHRFIQKKSMDNKMKMVDTAKIILEE